MLPESVSIPAPAFVRLPLAVAPLPEMASAVVTLIVLEVPFVRVKLRSVEPLAPVKSRVPPPNTRFPAAFVELPSAPATPPLVIEAMLSVPALIVVAPVKVLAPFRISVPLPA